MIRAYSCAQTPSSSWQVSRSLSRLQSLRKSAAGQRTTKWPVARRCLPWRLAPNATTAPSSLTRSAAGLDASRIADEVITHLVGLVGSSVRVTLEIEANVRDGVPDNVVRTVIRERAIAEVQQQRVRVRVRFTAMVRCEATQQVPANPGPAGRL